MNSETHAMKAAVEAARAFEGATAPNPAVGAAALDASGKLLATSAHEGAGKPHAEAALLERLKHSGRIKELHTLVVTLEPCNHQGRTPPCSTAIIEASRISPLKRVIFGSKDPNPKAQGGAEALRAAGLEVSQLETPEVQDLNAPFLRVQRAGLPWITVKSALREGGNRIPPAGQKTFTQPASLILAHELRRRSDAIVTGSGTVLADSPLFTVRQVADHTWRAQPRILAVLDRRQRVPQEWISKARSNGFDVWCPAEPDLTQLFKLIASRGALRVLVEAGAELTKSVLDSGLWSEHVVIHHFSQEPKQDEIHVYRNH